MDGQMKYAKLCRSSHPGENSSMSQKFCGEEETMVFLPNIVVSTADVEIEDPLKLEEPLSTPVIQQYVTTQDWKVQNSGTNRMEPNELAASKGELAASSQNIDNGSDSLKIVENDEEDLPHSCDICGKGFAISKQLNRHMRTHKKDIEDKPTYKCVSCPKVFKSESKCSEHQKTHSGNSCKVCGKFYKKSNKLAIHMRSHSGERPYVCKFCGKGYTVSTSLRDHLKKQHLAQYPYACSKCDETFKIEADLKEHEKTHPNKKPFACSFCEESFIQFSSLKDHLKFHI